MKVHASDSDCNANARAMHVGVIHELPLHSVLPTGWAWKIIDDIAEVNPKIDKSQIPDDLLVSFVPMPAVGAGNGYIDVSDKKPFSSVKKGFTPFKEGDVLFAKITPCMENGKMAVVTKVSNGYGFGSTEFHVLRPKEGIDAHYIYYYVSSKTFRGEAERYMTGAVGQKRVSTQYLRESKIPVAPPNEQTLIVSKIEKQFSRLDEAVAALKRIKANLKRYKASVLKAAVEGKLTEEWRRGSSRTAPIESGKDLLKRILAERRKKWEKDHPGKKYKEPATVGAIHELPLQNALPEGWVWATLSQLGELNRGKSKHRPRNAPHLYGGHYPFVQTGDIKNAKGILRQYTQTYSEAGLKQSKLWPVGTLCITIAANIADTAILGFNSCFPDSIVGFVVEPNHCDIRFVEYFIRTAKENIERFAPATAQKNINLEILSDIAVPLPPFIEQQVIVEEVERRLSVAEEIEVEIESNLKRADRLRQSILKKAFDGRLVPQAALKRRGNS